jgi:hypothetical protein
MSIVVELATDGSATWVKTVFRGRKRNYVAVYRIIKNYGLKAEVTYPKRQEDLQLFQFSNDHSPTSMVIERVPCPKGHTGPSHQPALLHRSGDEACKQRVRVEGRDFSTNNHDRVGRHEA